MEPPKLPGSAPKLPKTPSFKPPIGGDNDTFYSVRRGTGVGITLFNMGGRIDKKNYEIEWSNYWRSLPYGFKYNPRDKPAGTGSLKFFLPLNPQNIQVKTPFATNIVSTMYGTVEEHSEVRYHDIVISGTTGMTPKYSQIFREKKGGRGTVTQAQRLSYASQLAITGRAGGFFQRARALANNVVKQAEGVAAPFGPRAHVETGVKQALTGYAAFHNFFRFLLEYKRDTSGLDSTARRSQHPLQFLNYKDNIMYDCVIRDFSLVRSASDPMLYNYTVVMRCYNLRTLDKDDQQENILQRAQTLGLDGVETNSLFNNMAQIARGAKNIAYQLATVAGAV